MENRMNRNRLKKIRKKWRVGKKKKGRRGK